MGVQISAYRQAFHMLDSDDGGTIELGELKRGFELLGLEASDETMRAYLQQVRGAGGSTGGGDGG